MNYLRKSILIFFKEKKKKKKKLIAVKYKITNINFYIQNRTAAGVLY